MVCRTRGFRRCGRVYGVPGGRARSDPARERPRQASTFTYQLSRTAPNGRTAGVTMTGDASPTTGRFGAVPTAKPRKGTLSAIFYQRERQPLITGEATGPKGFPLTLRTPLTSRASTARRSSGSWTSAVAVPRN
jgi:hypothetical protein